MPEEFLHDRKDFNAFIDTVATNEKINDPALVEAVDRDTEYDDQKLRNAGLRLRYDSFYGSVKGLKDGILLEVGFDQTSPHHSVTISR